MARRTSPGQLAGALLLVASALVAASAVSGLAALETVGFGFGGAGLAALGDHHIRHRRFGAAVVLALLLAVGDRVADQAMPLDRPWALPLALGSYLVWTALVATPRAVINALAPSLVAVAVPLAMRTSGTDPLVMSLLLLPVAALCAAIAVPRARATAEHATLLQNQADLDAVVLANVELRHTAQAQDAASRIARIATELLEADGAVVWLQGPGRLLCAGGHGETPVPDDRETREGSPIERVLLTGALVTEGNEIVLPLTASGGVFGAVAVCGPRRPAASFVASVLQVFGAQAGYALERLRAAERLVDDRYVDPITGVGNRLAATASIATLRPGDAILLLSVDELLTMRAIEGDARADLALGQLGLHLRTATRAGDLVARFDDDVFFVLLRDMSSDTEAVVDRLLSSWQATGTAGRLRAGAALHFADTTPLDTLDRATHALDAARCDRNAIGAGA